VGYPIAETVANLVKVSDCVVYCKDTADLYGYKRFVFSKERARLAFANAYRAHNNQQDRVPTHNEVKVALAIIEERTERAIRGV
jgi:hypothetical protein